MLTLPPLFAIGAAIGINIVQALEIERRQYGLSYTPHINASRLDFSPVDLEIQTKGGIRNNTAPLLYGLFFEDITHSIDGGIYGELIRNRAFQGSEVTVGVREGFVGQSILASENPIVPYGPVLNGYRPIGDVRLSLDVLHPLSSALPTVLQLDIPLNATGEVGFLNEGWWGFDVKPQTYNASFYIMPSYPRYNKTLTQISVSLRSNLTEDVWVTSSIATANLSTFNYTRFHTQLHNTITAPNANNSFVVTFNASEVAGNTFFISLISLFGETFKERENGLRKDLAEIIYDAKPRFLRFPGGNNLEGLSTSTYWKWYETIGDLKDRPGRVGSWTYYNTDGLGLLEYLQWTEDMELEPILDVYAGATLDQFALNITNSVPEEQMQPVLQEAFDELEYITGAVNTTYGALRAKHGHPEPFKIQYIEIGNEDFFSNTYPYRFRIMYDGLKKAYPDITFISTQYNENPLNFSPSITINIPPGNMWDFHRYDELSWFLENFDLWDNWQEATNNTNVTIFLGEYSVFNIDTPDGIGSFGAPPEQKILIPELVSAIAEGVWILGAERNPNVVRMQGYAPILGNFNNYQNSPDEIAFTVNDTLPSASYWQQWLFGRYRGTQTLPVANTKGNINPLWWVALIDEPLNVVYLKAYYPQRLSSWIDFLPLEQVINSGTEAVLLSVNIDAPYTNVNGTILTGANLNDYNFFNNKTAVFPKPAIVPSGSGPFHWDVPPFSSTVLQFYLED